MTLQLCHRIPKIRHRNYSVMNLWWKNQCHLIRVIFCNGWRNNSFRHRMAINLWQSRYFSLMRSLLWRVIFIIYSFQFVTHCTVELHTGPLTTQTVTKIAVIDGRYMGFYFITEVIQARSRARLAHDVAIWVTKKFHHSWKAWHVDRQAGSWCGIFSDETFHHGLEPCGHHFHHRWKPRGHSFRHWR